MKNHIIVYVIALTLERSLGNLYPGRIVCVNYQYIVDRGPSKFAHRGGGLILLQKPVLRELTALTLQPFALFALSYRGRRIDFPAFCWLALRSCCC